MFTCLLIPCRHVHNVILPANREEAKRRRYYIGKDAFNDYTKRYIDAVENQLSYLRNKIHAVMLEWIYFRVSAIRRLLLYVM